MRRVTADERVRFLVTGGFNTVFGFLVFVAVDLTIGRAMDRAGLTFLASIVTVLLSHLIGSLVAFYLYRRHVFRVDGNLAVNFFRFQTVYLIPLLVNLVVLPALVHWGMPRIPAQAGITVVMTVVSYVGHKFFSFRRARPDAKERSEGSGATSESPGGH